MKKKILILGIAFATLASCQKKEEKQVMTEKEMEQPEVSVSAKDCYLYVKAKDTVKLTLITANGNNVSGDLVYNFFEKDKNSGTVSGMFKGDTLYADYTFQSEGTTSYRQIAFVKKGDQLLEGYGPMQETDGRSVFTNLAGLKFGDITLSPVNCK